MCLRSASSTRICWCLSALFSPRMLSERLCRPPLAFRVFSHLLCSLQVSMLKNKARACLRILLGDLQAMGAKLEEVVSNGPEDWLELWCLELQCTKDMKVRMCERENEKPKPNFLTHFPENSALIYSLAVCTRACPAH